MSADYEGDVVKSRKATREEMLKYIIDEIEHAQQRVRDNLTRLKEEFGFEHIAEANKKLAELAELRDELNEWS